MSARSAPRLAKNGHRALRQILAKEEVAGSIPVARSNGANLSQESVLGAFAADLFSPRSGPGRRSGEPIFGRPGGGSARLTTSGCRTCGNHPSQWNSLSSFSSSASTPRTCAATRQPPSRGIALRCICFLGTPRKQMHRSAIPRDGGWRVAAHVRGVLAELLNEEREFH